MDISVLQQRIINGYQKGFPVCPSPFKVIAKELDATEQDVIDAIADLEQRDVLSRLGPVFCHKKAGASTLAAIAVPSDQLDKVAGIVNQFDEVNHNYAREHDYNLWFVVTAKDQVALEKTIIDIELLTGLPVLMLPMEASYHIDLGFSINFNRNGIQGH